MEHKMDARRAADFRGPQRGEQTGCDSTATANCHFISDADEAALRQARAWREGRGDAWDWLVDRLEQAQEAGRRYESFRRLTDELSQVHDFTDDDGGKVSVPHRRGLGRGLALLMLEEHPEFGELFRMEGRRA